MIIKFNHLSSNTQVELDLTGADEATMHTGLQCLVQALEQCAPPAKVPESDEEFRLWLYSCQQRVMLRSLGLPETGIHSASKLVKYFYTPVAKLNFVKFKFLVHYLENAGIVTGANLKDSSLKVYYNRAVHKAAKVDL